MSAAYILGENVHIDPLMSFEAVEVPASKLAPGMILLDDLNCATGHVDHRMKARPSRTGEVAFLVEDLDAGSWVEARFHRNRLVKVAAR